MTKLIFYISSILDNIIKSILYSKKMSGTLSRKVESGNPIDVYKDSSGSVLYTVGTDISSSSYTK